MTFCRSTHYRYVGFPAKTDRKIYSDVISRASDYLRSRSHVKGFYRLGAIRDPGISDIDFLVLVDDRAPYGYTPEMRKHLKSISYLADTSVIQYSLSDVLHEYAYLPNLSHVFGARIPETGIPESMARCRGLLLIISGALQRLLFLRGMFLLGTFRVRRALLSLNSLRYSIDLLSDYCEPLPAAAPFLRKLKRIRGAWFSDYADNAHGVLPELIMEGIDLSCLILNAVAGVIRKMYPELVASQNDRPIVLELKPKKFLCFSGADPRRKITVKKSLAYRLTHVDRIDLPMELFLFFNNCLADAPRGKWFANRIIKGAREDWPIHSPLVEVGAKHCSIAHSHQTFLLENGDTGGGTYSVGSLINGPDVTKFIRFKRLLFELNRYGLC